MSLAEDPNDFAKRVNVADKTVVTAVVSTLWLLMICLKHYT